MPLTRVMMRTQMRAAAVDLLRGWAEQPEAELDGGQRLQVYPTIPTSIKPPCAYPERIGERDVQPGITQQFRVVVVRCIVLWRLFAEMERGDAVSQLDLFLDGFVEYTLSRFHQPGPTELIRAAAVDEDPYYVLRDPTKGDRAYYAGIITLEGQTAN